MTPWLTLLTLYELSERGEFTGEEGDLEEMETLYFKVIDADEEPETYRFSGRQKEEISQWAVKNQLSMDE